MSHRLHRLLVALALPLVLGAQTAPKSETPPALTVDTLAWMSGAWETESTSPRVEEQWTHPAGGTLLGCGRTLAEGKTVFFEFLRVETRAEGLVLVAQPKGKAGTDFPLVEADREHAVFANPAHDFPKRITYRRSGADGLVARVEGDGSEAEKAEEVRYRRRAAK